MTWHIFPDWKLVQGIPEYVICGRLPVEEHAAVEIQNTSPKIELHAVMIAMSMHIGFQARAMQPSMQSTIARRQFIRVQTRAQLGMQEQHMAMLQRNDTAENSEKL